MMTDPKARKRARGMACPTMNHALKLFSKLTSLDCRADRPTLLENKVATRQQWMIIRMARNVA